MNSSSTPGDQIDGAAPVGARRLRGRALLVGALLVVGVPALFGWWAGMLWALYMLVRSILGLG